MKVKTAELDGPALAWAVGTAEGSRVYRMRVARPIDWKGEDDNRWAVRAQVPNVGWFADYVYQPHTDPLQAWPIIDREDITWSMNMEPEHGDATRFCAFSYRVGYSKAQNGPTKLTAIMRCLS